MLRIFHYEGGLNLSILHSWDESYLVMVYHPLYILLKFSLLFFLLNILEAMIMWKEYQHVVFFDCSFGPWGWVEKSSFLIYYLPHFVKCSYSFFIYLIRFISEGIWSWTFFGGKNENNSVYLLTVFVFKLSLYSWDCFGNLCLCRNMSILLKLLNCWHTVVYTLLYSHFNFCSATASLQHDLQCVIFHSWFWQFVFYGFFFMFGITWYWKTTYFCKEY